MQRACRREIIQRARIRWDIETAPIEDHTGAIVARVDGEMIGWANRRVVRSHAEFLRLDAWGDRQIAAGRPFAMLNDRQVSALVCPLPEYPVRR